MPQNRRNRQGQVGDWGAGIGGPVSTGTTPDRPSYDPALGTESRDKRICALLSDERIGKLNDWEISFLSGIYGQAPLTSRQRGAFKRIIKKHGQGKGDGEKA